MISDENIWDLYISCSSFSSFSYIFQSYSANFDNKKKRFLLDVLVVCHFTRNNYLKRILLFIWTRVLHPLSILDKNSQIGIGLSKHILIPWLANNFVLHSYLSGCRAQVIGFSFNIVLPTGIVLFATAYLD